MRGGILPVIGFFVLEVLFYLPSIVIKLTHNPLHYGALAVVFFVVFFALLQFTDVKTFSAIGLTRNNGWKCTFGVGLLAGTFAPLLIFSTEAIAHTVQIRSIEPLPAWFPILGLAIAQYSFVAFAEELLMRGYLFRQLLKFCSPKVTLAIAAGIYAAHHWQHYDHGWTNMLRLFTDGLFYGLIYLKSRSLWYTIGAHLTLNTSSILFSIVIKYDRIGETPWLYEITPFLALPVVYLIVSWHMNSGRGIA
ncbi:CPBP family intramembrane metalloprotease [Paenibacillus sp. TRM 82003]|nr:CPBP family intramembrane metalloprotease [Paenibacillus sp. TRM 82003]